MVVARFGPVHSFIDDLSIAAGLVSTDLIGATPSFFCWAASWVDLGNKSVVLDDGGRRATEEATVVAFLQFGPECRNELSPGVLATG